MTQPTKGAGVLKIEIIELKPSGNTIEGEGFGYKLVVVDHDPTGLDLDESPPHLRLHYTRPNGERFVADIPMVPYRRSS